MWRIYFLMSMVTLFQSYDYIAQNAESWKVDEEGRIRLIPQSPQIKVSGHILDNHAKLSGNIKSLDDSGVDKLIIGWSKDVLRIYIVANTEIEPDEVSYKQIYGEIFHVISESNAKRVHVAIYHGMTWVPDEENSRHATRVFGPVLGQIMFTVDGHDDK